VRGLLDAQPDALLIVNSDGIIVFVNVQAISLFQYTANEMLNHKIEMLLPDHLREVHESHRATFFTNPQTREMGKQRKNLIGLRKDRVEFSVQISLSSLMFPEFGIMAFASVRDISEIKRLEQAEAAENHRQRLLIDSLKIRYKSVVESRESFASYNPSSA